MPVDYPDCLARGITDAACVKNGNVVRCAFAFDKNLREDGRRELSVQWLDDKAAERELKNRMRGGIPVFINGFAVLRTKALDEICNVFKYRGLCYVRSESRNNPFHGLIIMNEVGNKTYRKEICMELAVHSTFFEYQSELPTG